MFNEIVSLALLLFAIYGLVNAAGILSERSGIVNIGLNANVVAGVLGSLLFHGIMDMNHFGQESLNGDLGIDIASIFASAIFGLIVSFLFSFATITLKGDHVIVGTAMNILMPIVAFIFLFLDATNTGFFTPIAGPGTQAKVLIEVEYGQQVFEWRNLIFFGIAFVSIAAVWVMIRFTKIGLRIWASGENPHALAAAGVNVNRTRYIAQMFVGLLSGMAGGIFLQYKGGVFNTELFGVEGVGFVAMAMIVIAQWRIHWGVLVVLVFSIAQAALKVNGVKIFSDTKIPKEVFEAIPFVLPILVLPFFKKISNNPKHNGLIYDPAQR